MPRTADHGARRRQIIEAVREVLGSGGIDAVTVSRVAATAGISVGLVQHYFDSKDDLLTHTHADAIARLEQRPRRLVERGERAGQPIRQMLTDALRLYLPLDEERRTDHAVRIALLLRAGIGPGARQAVAEHHAWLRHQLATAVRNGKECGEVATGTDEIRAAHELVSVVLGLADQLHVAAAGPRSAEARNSVAVLRGAVDRVFAHPCRHHA